jgi:hypothetical protein
MSTSSSFSSNSDSSPHGEFVLINNMFVRQPNIGCVESESESVSSFSSASEQSGKYELKGNAWCRILTPDRSSASASPVPATASPALSASPGGG